MNPDASHCSESLLTKKNKNGLQTNKQKTSSSLTSLRYQESTTVTVKSDGPTKANLRPHGDMARESGMK